MHHKNSVICITYTVYCGTEMHTLLTSTCMTKQQAKTYHSLHIYDSAAKPYIQLEMELMAYKHNHGCLVATFGAQ